jgi:MFS family permease
MPPPESAVTPLQNGFLPASTKGQAPSLFCARAATYSIFLADGFGFGFWAGHIPVFKQRFALNDAQLSIALFSVALGAIFAMPVVGHCVRRFGSHALSGMSATLYAIVIACLPWPRSFSLFVFVTTFFGACKGSLDVSINAQAVVVESAYRRPIMSSFQACWSIGGLAGALLAAAALQAGFRPELNLSAVGFFILIVAVCSARHLSPEKPVGAAGLFIRPDRAILGVAALTFLALFSEGTMADWTGVYLHNVIGVPVSTAALAFAGYSLAMAAGRFLGDRLVQAIGPKLLLRISGLSTAAGLSLAILVRRPEVAIAGFAVVGLGLSNLVPILFGSAGRHRSGPGPGIAAVTTVGYFGFLVGPPLIGSLASLVSLPAALALVVAFGLIIAGSVPVAVD